MKIKHLLLASAALFVGVTSCSKSEGGGEGFDKNFDMFLQMDFEAASDTRAAVDYEVTGGKTTFNEGAIFFTKDDADRTIVRMVVVSDNQQAGTVTAADLAGGYLFKDVNKDARHIYVVGNKDYNGKTYSSIFGATNALKDETIDVTETKASDFGISRIPLYGIAPIVNVPATGGNADEQAARAANAEKMAVAVISPIMARFEIDQVSGDRPVPNTGGTTDPSDVDEFVIDGIYINNYYFTVDPMGQAASALTHNSRLTTDTPAGPWTDKYSQYQRTPTGQYNPVWDGLLFDDILSVPQPFDTQEALVQNPFGTNMKTWAYNVFAEGSHTPHIVLKLSKVKLKSTGNLRTNSEGLANGVAYLTVTHYYTTTTTSPEAILGGNVYKMKIAFNEKDLGDTPYPEGGGENVWVKVTVKDWEVRPVDPGFN